MTDLTDTVNEIRDRTRRIETRVTRYMADQGFDTQTRKPKFDRANMALELPSPSIAVNACIDAIPDDIKPGVLVDLYVGEDYIGAICK